MIAGARGCVTSPIPKRIIFLSGFASEYAFTFFAIVENK